MSNRIVNDATAMVVIGSAHDYARFGLDGTSLRDVLAVGKFGAEWREAAPVPLPDERVAPQSHALLAELRMTSFDVAPPAISAAPPVPVPPVRSRRPQGKVRKDLSERTTGPTPRPSWPARTRATACATRTPGCASGPSARRPTPTRATSWR
ncbi:hypothetical protein [Nannocystis pusilla]|uniref:hypothetical protein n=1 Tax=Nannocystis pusilla TaxID=889268 RepID=UPI003B7A8686